MQPERCADSSMRPYVLLSCAMSLDGYIDDASDERLLLSNRADFERVDAVRAEVDAILVGANTIRSDDPRLAVRSPERRHARLARGLSASPAKVTVTARGELDPASRFFAPGDAEKLVYCASAATAKLADRLAGLAAVVDAGDPPRLERVLRDLAGRGIRRLLVEGGAHVFTELLTAGVADELQLVLAPLFVGSSAAQRFVCDGRFPWNSRQRAELVEARPLGDVAVLRYALSSRFGES